MDFLGLVLGGIFAIMVFMGAWYMLATYPETLVVVLALVAGVATWLLGESKRTK